MATKRDGRKSYRSQFLTDYLKSNGPETSLQRGGENELFGHYWTDFVKQLQKASSKNTEKGGTSSKRDFFKTSSGDPENIFKPVDKEFVDTNVSLPSEFEKERELVGSLEDRGQPDTTSGICFTESQETREKMESQMELPSTSRQQSKVKPASDKLQTDSENLSTERSDIEASDKEADVTTEEELSSKQVRKKALAEDGKFVLEHLHCGHCGTRFGNAKSTLGKVMYLCRETEIILNKTFKCLSCSAILNAASSTEYHLVSHVRKNNLYCMECQIKTNDEKVIYDLETFDIPVTTPSEETKPKLLKLSRKTVTELLKFPPSCAACSTSLEDISEKIYRLFEIRDSENYKPMVKGYIYCCIVCSKCCTKIYDMEAHLLQHFHGNSILCRECYGGVSSPKNLRFISSTQMVDLKKMKRLGNFDTSLKINCGKCGDYLCESAVLEPLPVTMFQKSIEGDVLKIPCQKLHKCVLCLNAFNDSEIVKHITDHINSNHIVCKDCQNINEFSVATISKSVPQLRKYKDVKCTNCDNPFSERDLRSQFRAFSILRTAKKPSRCRIFVCEFCKTAYSDMPRIMKHLAAHISSKQIFCNSCATKANIDERLLQHCD